MRRLAPVLLVIVLVAVLVACSGGGDEPEPTSTTTTTQAITADPCSLLSLDDVNAITEGKSVSYGYGLVEAVSDADSGKLTCAWRNINGLAYVNLRLVRVGPRGLRDELKRTALAGERFVVVPGLGEEAVALFDKGVGRKDILRAIYARQGSMVVVLGVPGFNIATPSGSTYEIAIGLARTALGKLPA